MAGNGKFSEFCVYCFWVGGKGEGIDRLDGLGIGMVEKVFCLKNGRVCLLKAAWPARPNVFCRRLGREQRLLRGDVLNMLGGWCS